MNKEILWLYFWIFILAFLGLVGGVTFIRQFSMRRLAKKLRLSYTYRKFTNLEKISNIVSGDYKGKKIKIYDVQRILKHNASDLPNIPTAGQGNQVSVFDAVYIAIIGLINLIFIHKLNDKPFKKTVIEIDKPHGYVTLKGLLFLPTSKIIQEINKFLSVK